MMFSKLTNPSSEKVLNTPHPKPTVWVTGATGFVGQCVVPHWLNLGWHVVCVVRDVSASQAQALQTQGATLVSLPVDNAMWFESLLENLNQYRPEGFLHLATCFLGEHQPHQLATLIESNILFGTVCLEAWGRYVHQQRTHQQAHTTTDRFGWVLNMGTVWQHFEDAPYAPVNLYAATKQAFEALLQYYTEVYTLPTLTLKLYDTYGVSDTRRKVLPILRQAALTPVTERQPIQLTDGIRQSFHFLYETDLCDALTHAVTKTLPNMTTLSAQYALPSPNTVTLQEVVACFNAHLPAEMALQPQWGAYPYRTREMFTPPQHAVTPLPDWQARYTLTMGVKMLLGLPSEASAPQGDPT